MRYNIYIIVICAIILMISNSICIGGPTWTVLNTIPDDMQNYHEPFEWTGWGGGLAEYESMEFRIGLRYRGFNEPGIGICGISIEGAFDEWTYEELIDEDFGGPVFPPDGWILESTDKENSWTRVKGALDGDLIPLEYYEYFLWIEGYHDGFSNELLISPLIKAHNYTDGDFGIRMMVAGDFDKTLDYKFTIEISLDYDDYIDDDDDDTEDDDNDAGDDDTSSGSGQADEESACCGC